MAPVDAACSSLSSFVQEPASNFVPAPSPAPPSAPGEGVDQLPAAVAYFTMVPPITEPGRSLQHSLNLEQDVEEERRGDESLAGENSFCFC